MEGTDMRRTKERGTSIIEFAIVSTVLIPLIFGVVALGVNLGHTTQVIQISRDAGRLYAKGVDMSESVNQNIVATIAQPMGMTSTTTGNGVVILSKIQQVSSTDCSNGNLSGSACSNNGQYVIVNRIVIGNSSYTSKYGTPNSSLIGSNGDVASGGKSGTRTTQGYLNDPSAVASGFDSLMSTAGASLDAGQYAYLSEAYFVTPDVSYLGGPAAGGVYAKTVF